MKTYRIKEITDGDLVQYEVQRRSIFGFWYNPDNVDAYTTGICNTLDEAMNIIKQKLNGTKTKIIFISNERKSVRKHEQNKKFIYKDKPRFPGHRNPPPPPPPRKITDSK